MAFVEADRVSIRHYLGFSAIFLQADPRLENAIAAVQAIVDGGTRPTNDTEVQIKAIITDLQTIESTLRVLWSQAQVSKAEEVDLDVFRGMLMLRSEGRRLVNGLGRALSTRPRADIFGSAPLQTSGFDLGDMGTE